MMLEVTVAALVAVALLGSLFWVLSDDVPVSPAGEPTVDASPVEAAGDFTGADYSRLAFDLIYGRVPRVFDSDTLSQCDEAIAACERLREQYASQEPWRLRHKIMGWIDRYETETRNARAAIKRGDYQKRMQRYDKSHDASESRVTALRDSLRRQNIRA